MSVLAPHPSEHEPEALIPEARERQRRRRLLAAAGVAITAGLGLGIYAAATGTGASRTAAGRQNPAAGVECRMPSLAVRVLPMSNPTGLDRLLIQLTNRSSQPCGLAGFPMLRFYDSRGPIPFQYDRDGVVRNVALRPGRSAYTVFAKFRCDIGVTRAATRGTIALGGAPQQTAPVSMGPAICKPGIPAEGRVVLAYPFEPTPRLAYETSLAQS